MYLLPEASEDTPAVACCRRWKSEALDVATMLQKTMKKGQRGYCMIVLAIH
jgi:hypothetical protein